MSASLVEPNSEHIGEKVSTVRTYVTCIVLYSRYQTHTHDTGLSVQYWCRAVPLVSTFNAACTVPVRTLPLLVKNRVRPSSRWFGSQNTNLAKDKHHTSSLLHLCFSLFAFLISIVSCYSAWCLFLVIHSKGLAKMIVSWFKLWWSIKY